MPSDKVIEKLRQEGVTWQGNHSDVEEIQHLLNDFEVQVAQNGMRLLIINGTMNNPVGDPVVLNLGDAICFRDETMGVIRTTENHHNDVG